MKRDHYGVVTGEHLTKDYLKKLYLVEGISVACTCLGSAWISAIGMGILPMSDKTIAGAALLGLLPMLPLGLAIAETSDDDFSEDLISSNREEAQAKRIEKMQKAKANTPSPNQ